MESHYDENLNNSPFLKKLVKRHPVIIELAPEQMLVICIPRHGSYQINEIDDEDLLSHVLVPNADLPETHFNTDHGDAVLQDRKLIFRTKTGRTFEVNLLFEEIFYTKNFTKYKVWCIDRPLLTETTCKVDSNDKTSLSSAHPLYHVTNLKEAVNLLWSELQGNHLKNSLKKIDASIGNFRKHNRRCSDLNKLRNNLLLLYNHCLDILLMNRQLRDKCKNDSFLQKNLKLAVETYMVNAVYNQLFELITINSVEENEKFNIAVRNLQQIEACDLNIEPKLIEFISAMKTELLKIDNQTTVLDKVACLRRALNSTSEKYSKKCNNKKVLTTDDVIPALIFAIIKSGLRYWITNLYFLKNFCFTDWSCGNEFGAENFLVSTLEAALTFIAQSSLSDFKNPPPVPSTVSNNVTDILKLKFDKKQDYLTHLFTCIGEENEVGVIALLEPFLSNTESNSNPFFSAPQLCHPLCACESCVAKIAESTPNINSQDNKGHSALFIAVINGLPKMVTLLLAKGASADVVDESNWSPLHYAAAKGYQNILLLLLHAGAPINLVNKDGNSALHLACSNGHINCCKAILFFAEHMQMKLDVNGQNKHGDTPLHIAARWGFREMVETLIENGAKVDIINKFGQTCVDTAHNVKVAVILSSNDKSNSCGLHGSPMIHKSGVAECMTLASTVTNKLEISQRLSQAIAKGDNGLVMYLLGLPANPNLLKNGSSGCHPLCTCSVCIRNKQSRRPSSGNINETLDINDTDVDGNTPLHTAAHHGKLNIIKLLLQYGADTKRRNKFEQTALHLACKSKNISIVKELLKSSTVDIIDYQDSSGETALTYAVASGDLKLVETLLASEPNLQLKNQFGETALEMAQNNILPSIVDALNAAEQNSSKILLDNSDSKNI